MNNGRNNQVHIFLSACTENQKGVKNLLGGLSTRWCVFIKCIQHQRDQASKILPEFSFQRPSNSLDQGYNRALDLIWSIPEISNNLDYLWQESANMLSHNIHQDCHLIEIGLKATSRSASDDQDEPWNDLAKEWDTLQTQSLENRHDGINDSWVILCQGVFSQNVLHQSMDDHRRIILLIGGRETLHNEGNIRNILYFVDMVYIRFNLANLLIFVGIEGTEDSEKLNGFLA